MSLRLNLPQILTPCDLDVISTTLICSILLTYPKKFTCIPVTYVKSVPNAEGWG